MENKGNRFKNFLVSPLGKVVLVFILYFVVMGGLLGIITLLQDASFIIVIFAILFSYFGWQALSKITPRVFLIMPVGGWIVYFVVKGALSFFLGVFVAPYVIAKKIVESIQKSL